MLKEPQFIIKNGVLIDINIPENCTEIIIPDSVTRIGKYAFENYRSLKAITIPNSVTKIGYYAFHNCISLQSITIPNSVTEIDDFAFLQCRSLQSITIPDSVTTIGYCTFHSCISLQSITIPNSVTEIGAFAFDNCTSLQSAVIPKHLDCIQTDNYELQCIKEHIPISYLYFDRNFRLNVKYQVLHTLKEYNIHLNPYQVKQLYSYLHNHDFEDINFNELKQTGLLQENNIFAKEQVLEPIKQ